MYGFAQKVRREVGTGVQVYRRKVYRCVYSSTDVQVKRCTGTGERGVQKCTLLRGSTFKCVGVQVPRCAGVQTYRRRGDLDIIQITLPLAFG
jgi:hypothetical protein